MSGRKEAAAAAKSLACRIVFNGNQLCVAFKRHPATPIHNSPFPKPLILQYIFCIW
jgi:hypothetical protein